MKTVNSDYRSIIDLRNLLDKKVISAVELTQDTLSNIDKTNSIINSFVLITADLAIEQAKAADRRLSSKGPKSPLDGIPLAVKDLYDTAGVTTAGGTLAYHNRIPERDSKVVELLTQAGMIMIGKTNTHELAFGMTTNNPHYGPTRNPWNLDRVPGGSSGGSGAALSAGQIPAALGTDTGGSVRNPAAFCGITGHKPTYGLVSTEGIIPLSKTLDHAGPMARSAYECALLLESMLDPYVNKSFTNKIEHSVKGLTLAIIPSLLENCESSVIDSFEESLKLLSTIGVKITESEPNVRYTPNSIVRVEGATYIEDILRENSQLIGEEVRNSLLAGLDDSAHEYVRSLEWRANLELEFERTLHAGNIDGYIVPTCNQVAEIIGDKHNNIDYKSRNTRVFNQSRQPSISIPNGFDKDGLPTGLMISTKKHTDDLTLRIAHNFQKTSDFHLQRPLIQ
ncbi:MAG: amidase [Dehalococcoidia bacterium]